MNNLPPDQNSWLLHLNHANRKQEITLHGDKTYTLGRSPEADIFIDDHLASRTHAKLSHNPAGWQIDDLNSTNGIYSQGKKISSINMLPGKIVQIGNATLSVSPVHSAKPGLPPLSINNKLIWVIVLLCLCGLLAILYLLPQKHGTDSSITVDTSSAEKTTLLPTPVLDDTNSAALRTPAMEYYRQGLTLYETNHLVDAIGKWDLALALDQDNNLFRQRYNIALKELTSSIESYFNRGVLDKKYMRYYEAKQNFHIVLELSRNQPNSKYYENALKFLKEIEGHE